MKTIIQGTIGAVALLLATAVHTFGVVGQAIQVQGTNLVLSWPSQGYEYYMIQYWPDLTTPSVQLTNCYPANSTNRTTFLIQCCTLAAFGSGGGTNSGNSGSLDPSVSMSANVNSTDASDTSGSDLWVVQSDGSVLPFNLYPPGFDTNGMVLIAAPQSEVQNAALSIGAESFDGASGASPNGLSNGGCDCPSMGFFRVWHIPDWFAIITNYTFDGPTFIPVDFKDYVDRVDTITVLINGEPTPYAQFMPYVVGVQTNWGMGIYFDRLTNGVSTIQLVSTVRDSDTLNENTSIMVLSNLTQKITIGNTVTFTNWDDLILSNTYALRAQSTITNVDWEIDIFDINNNFVNWQTGHSGDGNIEWDWDLTDFTGASRNNSDVDPDFYPQITITPSSPSAPNAPTPSITRPTPVAAAQFPSVGAWLVTYMDNFYTDRTTNYPGANQYYFSGLNDIMGGPALLSIPANIFPLKYGLVYTNGERDASWLTLRSLLFQPSVRNLYYSGHGSATTIGGDFNLVNSSNYVIGSQSFPRSKAFLSSQWVRDNITFNKFAGARPYRFVWLDGCSTAAGDWPRAFGMPYQAEPLSYYQSTNNVTHARPSAFVGWDVTIGGKPEWGTIDKFWLFRSYWMGNWSVQDGYYPQGNLDDVMEQARSGSGWIAFAQMWAHLKIYGYSVMQFTEVDYKSNWP